MNSKRFIIALEEHYADPDVTATFRGLDAVKAPAVAQRLNDLTDIRIKEMDAAGIDVQVLSQTAPSVQKLDPESAIRLAQNANDRLYETIRAHPSRFAAFATIPTPAPEAAAAELERAVTKLGFKGAMVHGLTNGVFFDDKRFWPIFERAQALDVPIYLHPAIPHSAVIDAYYADYTAEWPLFLNAGWGYTVETATLGIRLVLSGVFDAYPRTKIILGHMGEGLPFFLWRINRWLSHRDKNKKAFREYFCEHFYITTSGFFSTAALVCCMLEIGIDRILFSVDYPYLENSEAIEWLEKVPLSPDDMEKMLSGNARRLLKI